MFLGSISLSQVDNLKSIFATFTENGWIIPEWLEYLEKEVLKSLYHSH